MKRTHSEPGILNKNLEISKKYLKRADSTHEKFCNGFSTETQNSLTKCRDKIFNLDIINSDKVLQVLKECWKDDLKDYFDNNQTDADILANYVYNKYKGNKRYENASFVTYFWATSDNPEIFESHFGNGYSYEKHTIDLLNTIINK
jgi:hypothetical protein